MKTIKFDLPIDGQKVATGDELRDHFTTEILDHFRNGVLARWLRTRPELSTVLAAVEGLAHHDEDKPTLLALCEAFGMDADEQTVEAALADATGAPPPSSVALASMRIQEGQVTRNLAPGREHRWRLDVPAPAFVQLQVRASQDIVCTLENARGRQLATDGTIGSKPEPRFAVILSRGMYYLRLRAVDEDAFTKYSFKVSQDHQVLGSDLAKFGRNMLASEDASLYIMDLDASREETSNNIYDTVWQQEANIRPDCAHLWVVNIPRTSVNIQTLGSTDTVGVLLSPRGRVLQKDDDGGSGNNFSMTPSDVLHGDFAIFVYGYGANEGDYCIQVGLDSADAPLFRSHGLKIVWDEYSEPTDWRS